ncbi:MAG TPA: response regulator transcription factor [Acidimicrobiales bacterium]|nr:response regulator transcription factor [Acidimicrobiales bacterium]
MSEERVRVVIVEDEPTLREALEETLRSEGFAVAGFADYEDPALVLAFSPDIALLDVLLPSGDGFDLARALRARREIPVLFLTARDALEDRLAGFATGADDYLIKPFAMEELLARLRVVLRRIGRLSAPLEAGDIIVDEVNGLATRKRCDLSLTATEMHLLAYFMRHRGALLSKVQLLSQVWGYDAYDENLVEVHVSALRRKLELRGPRVIDTVRNMGYRFVAR